MRPHARYRPKGTTKGQPIERDLEREEANKAAADMIRSQLPLSHQGNAEQIAQSAIAGYIIKRGAQSMVGDELVREALHSHRPWGMAKLIGQEAHLDAVLAGALPMLAEIAREVDPTGEKSFFQWSRPDVVWLLEAFLWVWEESNGRVKGPDPVTAPVSQSRLSGQPGFGTTLPATPLRGEVIEDEIPF